MGILAAQKFLSTTLITTVMRARERIEWKEVDSKA